MGITAVAALGARGQQITDVRQTFPITFDALVATYSANLISYWKFHNTGVDEDGVANATISGSPELNIPTIVDGDELVNGAPQNGLCIAWTGAAGQHAQAAHNAAHKTAAGTIIVFCQRDSSFQKSQLIMADASAAAGGVGIAVNTDGSPTAYIRDGGAVQVPVTGSPGDVQPGQAYALVFRWGTGGMNLRLFDANGTLVRQATDASTIGLSGTSVIRFGGSHADTDHHDGPYGRVIWLNRRITDAETTDFGNRARNINRAIAGYRDVELGLGPVALWGLGDISASPAIITDEVGSRDGQYHGALTFGAMNLPAGITDGSVNFAGTGFGTVPHDSGLLLAAYTISFWFRIAAFPGAGTSFQLVSKDAAGLSSGGTQVSVLDVGSLRFRMETGAAQFEVITASGVIALNTTYHVAARANNTGFELFLDGVQVGTKNTSVTAAWTANSHAIWFATSPGSVSNANAIIDEIALYGRTLSNTEIAELAQHSLPTYADTVNAIANLVAYYRFSNASLIVDELGFSNGTYGGSGHALDQGLPDDSNESVDFGPAAFGTVPHLGSPSAFVLPAFTLSLWFRQQSLPQAEIGGALPILMKESATNLAGDLGVWVDTEGDLVIRMQSGAASFTLGAPITLDTAYHLAIRADNTGFDAYLNGSYLGKDTGVTVGWSSNIQPLEFNRAPFFAYTIGDCTLDEVALYSRALTQGEILDLAQVEAAPPSASNDSVSLSESTNLTINVTANDTFVGAKAALTVEIMSQPAGGDSVSVNANNDIVYTAGAVAADTARSFTYRITDSAGTSNTATVNVTVQDTSVPPTPSDQANCYTENTTDAVVVSTMANLETQINAAPPGRTILIAAGTYAGGTRIFDPRGTVANPIVVRPQSGLGSVTINDANWTLATTSVRGVISKLYFNRSRIVINGSRNRVTRCRWRQINKIGGTHIFNATDTRVDHNDFSGYDPPTPQTNLGCMATHDNAAASGDLRRVLMDYNYIHDFVETIEDGNQVAFIACGNAGDQWNVNWGWVQDHNYMENCNTNTGEYINVKTSNVKIRYCTFINCRAYLQQRAGGGWEVRSNWFENMTNSAPLKAFDEWASGKGPQLVIGNRCVNQDIWVGGGNQNGGDTHSTPPYPTHRSRSGQFIGNNCRTLYVGMGWFADTDLIFPAVNNNLFNNIGTRVNGTLSAGGAAQTGTTTLNPATTNFANEPQNFSVDPWWEFTPAVKMARPTLSSGDDAGMFAPDPLCPSGPQTG